MFQRWKYYCSQKQNSQFLRILADGSVDCRAVDRKGINAHFVITTKFTDINIINSTVVTLQSAANTNLYLAIHQGIVIGTGQSGPSCEFQLIETPEKQVSFQAKSETPLCIGVSSDGRIVDPKTVHPGHHCSIFTATLIHKSLGAVKEINSEVQMSSSGMVIARARSFESSLEGKILI